MNNKDFLSLIESAWKVVGVTKLSEDDEKLTNAERMKKAKEDSEFFVPHIEVTKTPRNSYGDPTGEPLTQSLISREGGGPMGPNEFVKTMQKPGRPKDPRDTTMGEVTAMDKILRSNKSKKQNMTVGVEDSEGDSVSYYTVSPEEQERQKQDNERRTQNQQNDRRVDSAIDRAEHRERNPLGTPAEHRDRRRAAIAATERAAIAAEEKAAAEKAAAEKAAAEKAAAEKAAAEKAAAEKAEKNESMFGWDATPMRTKLNLVELFNKHLI